MSLGEQGRKEARAVTTVVAVLALTVAVGAVFPVVEQVLNVVFLLIGGVVLVVVVGMVVRDL